MFQYYNFDANWSKFYKHLRSREITAILKEHGLTHPLYHCSRGDGIEQSILDMTQNDEEYKMELSNLDLDDDKECNKLFDKYNKKYTNRKLLHINFPTGRCHDLAPALFAIATKMYPEKQWIHIQGDKHSTVLCVEEGIVFDLIFYYLQTRCEEDTTASYLYLSSVGKKKGEQCFCNNEYEIVDSSNMTHEDASTLLETVHDQ